MGYSSVDYLSLDVGGAETQILQTLPWSKVNIRVISVNHVHYQVTEKSSLIDYMTSVRGYQFYGDPNSDNVFVFHKTKWKGFQAINQHRDQLNGIALEAVCDSDPFACQAQDSDSLITWIQTDLIRKPNHGQQLNKSLDEISEPTRMVDQILSRIVIFNANFDRSTNFTSPDHKNEGFFLEAYGKDAKLESRTLYFERLRGFKGTKKKGKKHRCMLEC